jgi:hypothetical protein
MHPSKSQSFERARNENVPPVALHVDKGPGQPERVPKQLQVSATYCCSLHRGDLCRSRDTNNDLHTNSIGRKRIQQAFRLLITRVPQNSGRGNGEKCCES